MTFGFKDVLGAATGSPAATVKVAGLLGQVQSSVKEKAEKLGVLAGGSLGAGIFEAAARGAGAGEAKASDALAKESLGFTLSGAKEFGKQALVLGAAGVGLVLYLLFRRR